MQKDFHRRIIKKLLLGWLILSVVIGSLVAYTEFERIDAYVVGLARTNSTQLLAAAHNYFHDPTAGNGRQLEVMAQSLANERHFVMVEVYNQKKEKVVEYALPHIQEIMARLEKKRHDFLMGQGIEYMKVLHADVIYLKLIMPITDQEDQRIIGYFEGVYQVTGQEMEQVLWRVTWSIIQVVAAIFLATLILYPVIISLNRDLIILSGNLAKANIGILKVLGSAIAKRDSDTNAHNYRVTIYAIRLAEAIGLENREMQALIKGAFLHDVGKIAISDTILLKPGKLTEEEFAVMQTHVGHGVDIIQSYQWLHDAVAVVENHHEKYDGNGYLAGQQGVAIPKNARIFAIADVFDALTSKRPYKEPFSYERSVTILQESSGSHFDPELVDAFLVIAPQLYAQFCGNEQEDELNTQLDHLVRRYFAV
ncbi:MAG: HD-GYP domain-containing protein [Desulfurivibrionaceae bacterium]|jgi:putative nucleotidyltransferase with HDIG domain